LPRLLTALEVQAWKYAIYPVTTAFLVGLLLGWIVYIIIVFYFSQWRFRGRLMRLAKLRIPGTAIRTAGMTIHDPKEVAAWVQRTLDWNGDVVKAISKISGPDSERFSTLGYPGTMRPHHNITFISNDHALHDCREQLLEKFYDQYSAKQ